MFAFRFHFPHALTIISVLIVLSALSTFFVPAGKFDRKYDKQLEREVVIPNTYKAVDSNPQGYKSVFTSFIKGIQDASAIVAYVLVVGGAYGIIMSTGALNNGLAVLIKKLGTKVRLLIPIVMLLLSIAGTTAGMWEETLVFYAIMVALMVSAGFDALVGVAVIVLGAGTGNLASTLNPFATGIASQIAEIPLKDGISWRVIAWVCCVIVSVSYVLWYASRVHKNPEKSFISAKKRQEHIQFFTETKDAKNIQNATFSKKDALVVTGFVANIGTMMYGVINHGWYMAELSMSFLTLALFSAIVFKMNETKLWENFIKGSESLVSAALVIGFARAIVMVADEGNIVDTVLNFIANTLSGLSSTVFIVVNLIFQLFVGIFVPSSSGHAALTMSIMAPLADLFSIPRSSVVTAMQFASGLANFFTPTAGVLMAGISIAKIGYGTWLKFVLPLLVIQFIITAIILVLSVSI